MDYIQMRDTAFIELWTKAKRYGYLRGLSDESEDFASEYILRKLQGKSKEQSLNQFYKDYLDYLNTNQRKLSYNSSLYRGTEELMALESNRPEKFNLEALTQKQRDIFDLYFIKGLFLHEIGKVFQVHESTVSKWVSKIEIILKDKRP